MIKNHRFSIIIINLLLCCSNISLAQCTLSYQLKTNAASYCIAYSFRVDNITGGVGPYQYSFYQANYFTDWNVIEPACSGITKFWIKDVGTGCVVEDSIVIPKPTDPSQGNQYIGTDGAWENPANWSCGFVPESYSDVFIISADVTINSNVVVNSLTIRGGKVTFAPGATITIKHFGDP